MGRGRAGNLAAGRRWARRTRLTSRPAPRRRWAEGGDGHGGQARDQPDRLDQRRHAGAGWRHAARDLSRRRRPRPASRASRRAASFPTTRPSMQAVLGKHGLELVSGWFSGELLDRGVEAEIEAMRPHLELLKACGSKVVIWAETSGTVQGKRNVPVADRPVMSEGDWPGYLRNDRQARRLDGRERRAHGVPPSHGHGDREGARDRPAAGRHARDRGPALRHRPSHLRRRGSGRGGAASGPSGSTTSTPRTCGPTSCGGSTPSG